MLRFMQLARAVVLATLPLLASAQSDRSGGISSRLPATARPATMTPGTPGDAPRTTPGAKSGIEAPHAAPTTKSLHDWERGHRGSRIIGTDVRNLKNERIGEVKDIVLDDKGTVAYAVVGTGSFLGLRDKLHAVPWRALQTNAGKDHFVLDMDKARLATVPGFDANSWPDFADPRWNAENRKHFGAP